MYNTLDNLVNLLDNTQNVLEFIEIYEGLENKPTLLKIYPLSGKFRKSLDMLNYTLTLRSILRITFEFDVIKVYLEEHKEKKELEAVGNSEELPL